MCYCEWTCDGLDIENVAEFEQWIHRWPEVDFDRHWSSDRVYIYPNGEYDWGDGFSLPTLRRDCDDDWDALTQYDPSIFLEELSWRLRMGSVGVIECFEFCGGTHAFAIAFVNGSQPFEERHITVNLADAAYTAAADLEGRQRFLLAAE